MYNTNVMYVYIDVRMHRVCSLYYVLKLSYSLTINSTFYRRGPTFFRGAGPGPGPPPPGGYALGPYPKVISIELQYILFDYSSGTVRVRILLVYSYTVEY